MPDTSFLTILGLGFLLGAKHALDADHVAAVSTLLVDRPAWRTSGIVGFCWGFGHTVTLLLVGLLVIVFKLTIPEPVAQGLELGVGLMLIVLGGSLAATLVRARWHVHVHRHEGESHLHLHSHRLQPDHAHAHGVPWSVRPVLIGMVHGLAGSAALMLLVLAAVRSVWEGLVYILVFGVGSIAGMMLLGMVISVPLVMSVAWGRRAQFAIQGLASLGSIGLGVTMVARIALEALPF
ncbi:MAG: sulfite exporter TauE/SafE family protein [Nitrospirota bacterium]|nr:sulfite exporter TauE/SafE family protein [Nitrospirota bacterium]